jgi:fibronectin type 3 domain-containing protein
MGKGILSLLVVLCLSLSPLTLPPALDSDDQGSPDVARIIDLGKDNDGSSAIPDLSGLLSGLEGGFTENLGQVADPEVRFYASGGPLSVALKPDGLVFKLRGPVTPSQAAFPEDKVCAGFSFSMEFVGCNPVSPRGALALGHTSNFFLGCDSDGWVTGARSYSEVLYDGIYDGIDLRFYLKDGNLKYDLDVSAFADPGQILLRYVGVPGVEVDIPTGDLVLSTPLGTVRDIRPVVLQDRPGSPWSSPAAFQPLGDGTFAFALPAGLARDLPFVIDPGIEASTFFGGRYLDQVRDVTVGPDGSVYVTGTTFSVDFPVTSGANDTTPDTEWSDAYMAKLDPTLSHLLVSTFVGGPSFDTGNVIELAPDGGVYITGYTMGAFPATPDALFGAHMGDNDVFFCKLSSDGSRLLYSTLLGGSGSDLSFSMRLGPGGDVFISGQTSSSDLPFTPGAFCSTYEGSAGAPETALFAMRLDASLTTLEYCTYINGIAPEPGSSRPKTGLAIDGEGNALLCGAAYPSFPTTEGTVHPDYIGGTTDAFVLELDPTGSRVLRSTFLGGSGPDGADEVAVAGNGTIYVGGFTVSDDLDTTPDAPQRWHSEKSDMLVAALSRDMETQGFCSYFGGRGDDAASDIVLGAGDGRLLILGVTFSSTLPWTPGCYDPQLSGARDCALVALNLSTMDFDYCTYLGGSGLENNFYEGLAECPDGGVYIAQSTESADFPTTPGANDTTYGDHEDGFVTLLDPTACGVPAPPANLTAFGDDGVVRLSWAPHTMVGYTVTQYHVYRGDAPGALEPIANVPGTRNWTEDLDVTNGQTYYYAVAAVNSAGEGAPNNTTGRPLALPLAPWALRASTGNGTVNLSWSAPLYSGGELLGYTVLRGPSNASMTRMATGLTAEWFEDTTVSVGTTYWYAVAAFNTRGTGNATEAIEVKALAHPSPPRSLSAVPGDLLVELAWGTPETDGGSPVAGYLIYRGTEDNDMSLLNERGAGTLSYTDHVRANGVRYLYRVSCRTDVGESPPTPVVEAVPFGLPGPPRDFVVTAADGQTTISWTPPLDDNGRPISDYVIYYGISPGRLQFTLDAGIVTTLVHTGLTNGVMYYYEVAAVNEAGEGLLRTETASARPMGLPGAVTYLTGEFEEGAIRLSWKGPAEMGGAESLNYDILRGISEDALETYATLVDQEGYTDTALAPGATYYYQVVVSNELGSGPPSEVISVRVLTAPGIAGGLEARSGNGFVELTWTAPEDNGGTDVTGYIVLRGADELDLGEIVRLGPVLSFNDTGLVNGVTLHYAVRAINRIGTGPASGTVNATPLGLPGVPSQLLFEVKDGNVLLSWGPPAGQGSAPLTGYVVLRGEAPDAMSAIAELGLVTDYTDTEAVRGRAYYYSVAARNAVGQGPPFSATEVEVPKRPSDGPGFEAAVALVSIALATMLFYQRRWGRCIPRMRR